MLLATVRLLHVDDLIHGVKYPERIAVHQVIQFPLLFGMMVLPQRVQRPHHHGQGSLDLVRKLREHVQFLILYLRFLDFLLPDHPFLRPAVAQEASKSQHKRICQPRPGRKPERSLDPH